VGPNVLGPFWNTFGTVGSFDLAQVTKRDVELISDIVTHHALIDLEQFGEFLCFSKMFFALDGVQTTPCADCASESAGKGK
jgi:hypothetical protein